MQYNHKVNNVSFPNLTVEVRSPFMAHDRSEPLENGVGFCAEVADDSSIVACKVCKLKIGGLILVRLVL